MTWTVSPGKHGKSYIGRAVIVGLIAGVIMAVVGVFVLPPLGLSGLALPIVVGAMAGIVAPWISKYF